jgi:hypothetical protein
MDAFKFVGKRPNLPFKLDFDRGSVDFDDFFATIH